MKSLICIILIIISINLLYCQNTNDTTKAQKEKQKTEEKKTDKFIDKDGDGISDNRTEGLGVKNAKHRHKNKELTKTKNAAGKVQPTGAGTGKKYRGGNQ